MAMDSMNALVDGEFHFNICSAAFGSVDGFTLFLFTFIDDVVVF